MKKLLILSIVGLIISSCWGCVRAEVKPIGMAVEFNTHAACAYIAQDKGWFKDEGLELSTYETYVTGMALAAALARGDIQVAYICLVPAILAYANAGVPIKIVAGTHKYGYGLVVNPDKMKSLKDLEKPDVYIGCCREGSPSDVLLHKVIDEYELDESKVLKNVRRMNPPQQVLAIKMGQLDAAFLPEHYPAMAEEFGFEMLLMSQDVWHLMQGSVLVVKKELIENHPETVRGLIKVSQRATDWANQHPDEAAGIMARQLTATGEKIFPAEAAEVAAKLEITPEVVSRSMGRLKYTTDVNPQVVQDTIDYMVELGYIESRFKAEDILDLSFLEGE